MTRALVIAIALVAIGVPALAQQPDPAFMQKTIAALQAQRNEALDWRAALEAKLALAMDENTKLTARVKELEEKLPKEPAAGAEKPAQP